MSLCREVKRPFREIAEDIESPQENPSKRMRTSRAKEEKEAETPRTSAEDPSPVVQVPRRRRKWNLPFSKTLPVLEERATETKEDTNIWIIGSSYIHRGEKAARESFGKNLGLNANVKWFGKGGMRWSGVCPRFYSELSWQSPPDVLVIHSGGNDLGLVPARKLAAAITWDLMQLHKEFPAMTIIYSCINERQAWRYGKPCHINHDRRTVNTLIREAADKFGGKVVHHPLLRFFNNNLYLPDRVHFTQEGNRLFLSDIRGVLKKILHKKKPDFFL
ncbi:uncharacterized protein [Paralichthys olivaceus]|uniref:uncharacterized protein n=1 Tax=Paralichthys olivaceus TaxID=8255 RepID=UPI0037503B4A